MSAIRFRTSLLVIASALLVSAVAYLPMVVSGHISRDSGVFQYTGMVISRGGMPYVDSWDHKGPLLAAIEALAWRIGGGIVGAPLVEGMIVFVGLAVAGVIWSQWLHEWAALVVLIAGVSFLALYEGGNFSETWLFPFQLVAYSAVAHVVMRSGRDASGRATATLGGIVGVATAVGLFTRMNNIVGVLVLAGFVTVYFRRRAALALAAVSVVAATGAVLVLWLCAGDALRAGLDQYLRYNLFYSRGALLGERIGAFATLSQLLVSSAIVATALVIVGARLTMTQTANARSSANARVLVAMIVVGGVDVLSQMASGRDYPHYLVVAIAGFTVAIVVGGAALAPVARDWWVARRTPQRRALFVASVLALFALVVSPSSATALQGLRTTTEAGVFVGGSYQAQIVARVLAETDVDDRVLVHGAETWILASAQRLSPTSITYSLPVEQGYSGLPAQYFADVTSLPPTLIVESPTSCGISIECLPERDRFEGLASWVASSYVLEGDVAGFRFWRRTTT
jgi:hypothetical protein